MRLLAMHGAIALRSRIPTGFKSISPGLRGMSYPGLRSPKMFSTLKGLYHLRHPMLQLFQSCFHFIRLPSVVASRQRWAE